MKGHFVYQWVLEEMAFLPSPSTRESIPRRPLPRTRAFLGVFDNSRGERDHGKATKTQGHMGRLNVKSEEAIPAVRSSLDSLCLYYHQKSGQEAAGYKGGVICEYLAYWYLCLPVYYIYGVLTFIAFAVNDKKIISQQFVGHHRSLITNVHTQQTYLRAQLKFSCKPFVTIRSWEPFFISSLLKNENEFYRIISERRWLLFTALLHRASVCSFLCNFCRAFSAAFSVSWQQFFLLIGTLKKTTPTRKRQGVLCVYVVGALLHDGWI